jgi:toxin ParE1/3/4
MLPIIWKLDARADLASVIKYIAKRDIQAARHMRKRLQESVLPVADHPYLYRQSDRYPGCREIVAHPNYIVVYRVEREEISVLRVLHSRQQYP